jgi:hypothetical protein
MTQQLRARVATAVVIVSVAGFVLWREGKISLPSAPVPAERAEPQPHDALYRMLDAVRDGDLRTYLDTHTGAMAESLRRAVAEMGETGFIEALQRQNRPIKGVAVNDPERLSPTIARARVEYVFADRNEVQTVYFENEEGRWRISRVDSAASVRAVVPYGTPVGEVR